MLRFVSFRIAWESFETHGADRTKPSRRKNQMRETLKALTKGATIRVLFNTVENGRFRSLQGSLDSCKECKDGSLQVILAVEGGFKSFKADHHVRTLTVEGERI